MDDIKQANPNRLAMKVAIELHFQLTIGLMLLSYGKIIQKMSKICPWAIFVVNAI